MLHAAETWAMKADTLNRLRRNDHAMICLICNVKAMDQFSDYNVWEYVHPNVHISGRKIFFAILAKTKFHRKKQKM